MTSFTLTSTKRTTTYAKIPCLIGTGSASRRGAGDADLPRADPRGLHRCPLTGLRTSLLISAAVLAVLTGAVLYQRRNV